MLSVEAIGCECLASLALYSLRIPCKEYLSFAFSVLINAGRGDLLTHLLTQFTVIGCAQLRKDKALDLHLHPIALNDFDIGNKIVSIAPRSTYQ